MKSAGMALGHRGPHKTRRRDTEVGPTAEFVESLRAGTGKLGVPCRRAGGRLPWPTSASPALWGPQLLRAGVTQSFVELAERAGTKPSPVTKAKTRFTLKTHQIVSSMWK